VESTALKLCHVSCGIDPLRSCSIRRHFQLFLKIMSMPAALLLPHVDGPQDSQAYKLSFAYACARDAMHGASSETAPSCAAAFVCIGERSCEADMALRRVSRAKKRKLRDRRVAVRHAFRQTAEFQRSVGIELGCKLQSHQDPTKEEVSKMHGSLEEHLGAMRSSLLELTRMMAMTLQCCPVVSQCPCSVQEAWQHMD
jgi:hypothetical protein